MIHIPCVLANLARGLPLCKLTGVHKKKLLLKSAGTVTFCCTHDPPPSPGKRDGEVCVSTRDALDRLILRKSQHAFDPTHMLSSPKEHLPNKLMLLSLARKMFLAKNGEWRLWKVDFNIWVLREVLFNNFDIFSFTPHPPQIISESKSSFLPFRNAVWSKYVNSRAFFDPQY